MLYFAILRAILRCAARATPRQPPYRPAGNITRDHRILVLGVALRVTYLRRAVGGRRWAISGAGEALL